MFITEISRLFLAVQTSSCCHYSFHSASFWSRGLRPTHSSPRLRIFTYTSRYTFFVTHFIRLLRTSVTQTCYTFYTSAVTQLRRYAFYIRPLSRTSVYVCRTLRIFGSPRVSLPELLHHRSIRYLLPSVAMSTVLLFT